ncbi:MAG: hypothetical protein ACRER2_19275 [Methylococcales bacterium]
MARLDALIKAQQAVGLLEDALQRPLEQDAQGLPISASGFGPESENQ